MEFHFPVFQTIPTNHSFQFVHSHCETVATSLGDVMSCHKKQKITWVLNLACGQHNPIGEKIITHIRKQKCKQIAPQHDVVL